MNKHHKTDGKKNVKRFLDLIQSLEGEVQEISRQTQPTDKLIGKVKKQIFELLSFFMNFEDNHELQHKFNVYSYIAKFMQEKLAHDNIDFNTCLSAAYFLCNETDPELVIEKNPSSKTQKLISLAQEQLIAVKVHYFKDKERETYNQKTEIFSLLTGNSKPTVKKIEELDVNFDDLPAEIRHIFIKENDNLVSFQVYP